MFKLIFMGYRNMSNTKKEQITAKKQKFVGSKTLVDIETGEESDLRTVIINIIQ